MQEENYSLLVSVYHKSPSTAIRSLKRFNPPQEIVLFLESLEEASSESLTRKQSIDILVAITAQIRKSESLELTNEFMKLGSAWSKMHSIEQTWSQ